MRNITEFAFIVFTAVCILVTQASFEFALDLSIEPNEVNVLETQDVEILCQVGRHDLRVTDITLFQLQKDGHPIVTIPKDSEPCLAKDLKANFKAEGNITKPVGGSHIRVTISNPEKDDFTRYTCLMYYLDEKGFLNETHETWELTMSQIDAFGVKYFADMVKRLEEKVDDVQKNAFKTKEGELQGEITLLTNRIGQLEQHEWALLDKIGRLEEMSQAQKSRLDDVIQKDNTAVNFVAIYQSQDTFNSGTVLVFGRVLVNEGGGYNNKTGVFTAPVAGYYLFHVSVYMDEGRGMYLDLRNANNEVLTRLFAGEQDGQWDDYSDASCVVKLGVGDQVKPVIRSTLGTESVVIDTMDSHDRLNKFYGYLLDRTV